MGCAFSVCGIPKDTNSEKHVVLRTSDSLTLMVKGHDRIKLVPLRKSLEVVVVERRNSQGKIIPEAMLVQQSVLQQEHQDRSAPREHHR